MPISEPDEPYVCPHCGGADPKIHDGRGQGDLWYGNIDCNVCGGSYTDSGKAIPIKDYYEISNWIAAKSEREKEEKMWDGLETAFRVAPSLNRFRFDLYLIERSSEESGHQNT